MKTYPEPKDEPFMGSWPDETPYGLEHDKSIKGKRKNTTKRLKKPK